MYFGHFSCVIFFPFFPSCPSCLAECKQIFLYFRNFITKSDQKPKTKNGMNYYKDYYFPFKSNRLSENVVCWRIYKGYPKVTWHGSRKTVITSVVARGKGSVWPGQCSKTPESTFWTTPCPPLIPAYGFEFLTKFLEIEGCSVKKHESLSPKIKDSCQSWTIL